MDKKAKVDENKICLLHCWHIRRLRATHRKAWEEEQREGRRCRTQWGSMWQGSKRSNPPHLHLGWPARSGSPRMDGLARMGREGWSRSPRSPPLLGSLTWTLTERSWGPDQVVRLEVVGPGELSPWAALWQRICSCCRSNRIVGPSCGCCRFSRRGWPSPCTLCHSPGAKKSQIY